MPLTFGSNGGGLAGFFASSSRFGGGVRYGGSAAAVDYDPEAAEAQRIARMYGANAQVGEDQARAKAEENRKTALRIIEQLEARGITSGAEYEKFSKAAQGINESSGNWFTRALGWLDRPGMLVRYLIADVAQKDVQEGTEIKAGDYWDVLTGRHASVKQRLGEELVGDDARMSGSQLLHLWGYEETGGFGAGLLRGIASVGTEILTDPLSLVGSPGANKALRLSTTTRVVRAADDVARAAVKVGRHEIDNIGDVFVRSRASKIHDLATVEADRLARAGVDAADGSAMFLTGGVTEELWDVAVDAAADKLTGDFIREVTPQLMGRNFGHPAVRELATYSGTPGMLKGGVRLHLTPAGSFRTGGGWVIPGTPGLGRKITNRVLGESSQIAGQEATWIRGFLESAFPNANLAIRNLQNRNEYRTYLRGIMGGTVDAAQIDAVQRFLPEAIERIGFNRAMDVLRVKANGIQGALEQAGWKEVEVARVLERAASPIIEEGVVDEPTILRIVSEAFQAEGIAADPSLVHQVSVFVATYRATMQAAGDMARQVDVLPPGGLGNHWPHIVIPEANKALSALAERGATTANKTWQEQLLQEMLNASGLRRSGGGVVGETRFAQERAIGQTTMAVTDPVMVHQVGDAFVFDIERIRATVPPEYLDEFEQLMSVGAELHGGMAPTHLSVQVMNEQLTPIVERLIEETPGVTMPKLAKGQVFKLFDDNPFTVAHTYLGSLHGAIVERLTVRELEKRGLISPAIKSINQQATAYRMARALTSKPASMVTRLARDVQRRIDEAGSASESAAGRGPRETISIGGRSVMLPEEAMSYDTRRTVKRLLKAADDADVQERRVIELRDEVAAKFRKAGIDKDRAAALAEVTTGGEANQAAIVLRAEFESTMDATDRVLREVIEEQGVSDDVARQALLDHAADRAAKTEEMGPVRRRLDELWRKRGKGLKTVDVPLSGEDGKITASLIGGRLGDFVLRLGNLPDNLRQGAEEIAAFLGGVAHVKAWERLEGLLRVWDEAVDLAGTRLVGTPIVLVQDALHAAVDLAGHVVGLDELGDAVAQARLERTMSAVLGVDISWRRTADGRPTPVIRQAKNVRVAPTRAETQKWLKAKGITFEEGRALAQVESFNTPRSAYTVMVEAGGNPNDRIMYGFILPPGETKIAANRGMVITPEGEYETVVDAASREAGVTAGLIDADDWTAASHVDAVLSLELRGAVTIPNGDYVTVAYGGNGGVYFDGFTGHGTINEVGTAGTWEEVTPAAKARLLDFAEKNDVPEFVVKEGRRWGAGAERTIIVAEERKTVAELLDGMPEDMRRALVDATDEEVALGDEYLRLIDQRASLRAGAEGADPKALARDLATHDAARQALTRVQSAANQGHWSEVSRLLSDPKTRRLFAETGAIEAYDQYASLAATRVLLADSSIRQVTKDVAKANRMLVTRAAYREDALNTLKAMGVSMARLVGETQHEALKESIVIGRKLMSNLGELGVGIGKGTDGQLMSTLYAGDADEYLALLGESRALAREGGWDELGKALAEKPVYSHRAKPGEVLIRNFDLTGEAVEFRSTNHHVGLFLENMVRNLQTLNTAPGLEFLGQQARGVGQWWKAMATVARPTFHVRNLIGAVWNNQIAGVRARDYLWVKNKMVKLRSLMDKGNLTFDDALLDASFDVADRAVLRDMRVYGVMDATFSRTEGLRVGSRVKKSINPGSVDGPLVRAGGMTMETIEDFARAAAFKRWYDEMGPQVAADWSIAVHFDYRNLTGMEERIKKFVPFFVWTRRNLPLQLATLIERPDLIQRYQHLMHGMDDQFDYKPYDDLPGNKWTSTLQIGTGFVFNADTPFWARAIISPDLPLTDLGNIENPLSIPSWLNFVTSTLGPHVTTPFEMEAQSDWGMVNAPMGLAQIMWSLDKLGIYDNISQDGSPRMPRNLRTLAETALPVAGEYLRQFDTDPSRAQHLGIPSDAGMFSMDRLRGAALKLASGFGLRTDTPHDAYSNAYAVSDELAALIKELRLRGVLPQPVG